MSTEPRTGRILIVDDEVNVRTVLATLVTQAGHEPELAENGDHALQLVRDGDPDVVLTDLAMPGMDGLTLLSRLRVEFPEIPVVLLTAHGTVENAVEAMKLGAFDFLTKPFDRADVVAILDKALGHAALSRREWQGPACDDDCGLLGASAAIEEIRNRVRRVAPSPSTILVTGETGTGKEVVADAIHRLSDRSGGPMVKVNCGALPDTLVESELFGHERGAFTGADRARPGRFELAHRGTLFLDEIGELPEAMQVKLLRVLEDGEVDRVGGTRPVHVDVRVVAATHRDLPGRVAEGRFRQDLLYRLNVVEIHVPPLRERPEDVEPLLRCFVQQQAARLSRPRAEVSDEAIDALRRHPWPGNVRELQNAAERAVLLAEGPVLRAHDFLDTERGALGPTEGAAVADTRAAGTDLKAASRAAAARTERRMIEAALRETDDNVTRAADKLGLSRRGLQIKMRELGLR